MRLPGFIRAYQIGREAVRKDAEAKRSELVANIVRDEVKRIFSALDENKQNKAIGAILSNEDITDQLLRRFVQTCPPDKHVEVNFLRGDSIIISGSAPEKRGPGW